MIVFLTARESDQRVLLTANKKNTFQALIKKEEIVSETESGIESKDDWVKTLAIIISLLKNEQLPLQTAEGGTSSAH